MRTKIFRGFAPGKTTFDWWHSNRLSGVDFRSGINTKTYHYYIDFAADHHIEHVNIDEGWFINDNLATPSPELDLPALVEHAQQRNVGLFLWMPWSLLAEDIEGIISHLARLGAVGIKVDFIKRGDVPAIEFYHAVAETSARHRLMVNFHGATNPPASAVPGLTSLTTKGYADSNIINSNAPLYRKTPLPFPLFAC